jgi:hypothetical protein
MKPKLKPPGSERLKLMRDVPLSNFAFDFYLRRYIMMRQNDAVDKGMGSKRASVMDTLTLDGVTLTLLD